MNALQTKKDRRYDLSAILVSYNTEGLIEDAMEALVIASYGLTIQVIIVDNASSDGSVALIRRKYPDCELIENKVNVGFGRANNQALPLVQGRYVLLLNTDAFVASDTLKKTIDYMDDHSECGILGVKLVGRDGDLQPSCRYFPTPLNIFLNRTGLERLLPWVRMMDDMGWDHASPRECDWVPGCYFLIRRNVIEQIGLFDERYFLYSEEVDLCFAAKRAGWQVHYFPDTKVIHLGGESAQSEGEITKSGRQLEALQIESELLFFRKNRGIGIALLDAILHTMADVIVPTKRLLKANKPMEWVDSWKHSQLTWLLFWRTRWGTHPTR